MELNFKKNQDTIVLYLKGRIDVHNIDEIDKEIKSLLGKETASHFILNLQDIDYVCSSGLGLFVSIMEILKQRTKKFCICGLKSSVKRIMELVEINIMFNIFEDENEAFVFLSMDK